MRITTAPPSADMAKPESRRVSEKLNEPDQLRQLKKSWDVSDVTKGSVADRIKFFKQTGKSPDDEQPDLSNTGKTNPSLKKHREPAPEPQQTHDRQVSGASVFAKSKRAKLKAVIKIQAIVRRHQAQAVAKHKAEHLSNRKRREREQEASLLIQAVARTRLAQKRAAELRRRQEEAKAKEEEAARAAEELVRQDAAATRIQAVWRSALTRVQVCRMVEEMIAELMNKRTEVADMEKEMDEAEEAAKAEAERKAREEEELNNVGAAARDRRRAEEEAKQAEEEALRKKLEEEKAKADLAKIVPRKKRVNQPVNLFVGPLPWGVGLLPEWWLKDVPHNTLFLDTISEEDNGMGFEEWRTGNVVEE